MLKCGFARTDITPKLGLRIPGYFTPREADGILDPLYARAFVADDGNAAIGVVVLDIIHVSAATTKMVRDRVAAFTDMKPENIMVAATHTHTGSSTDRTFGANIADSENVSITATLAADAIILAYNKREEARIGYGSCEEYGVAFNRRFRMKDGSLKTNPGVKNPNILESAGVIDPQVGVLRVDRADGTPLGAVVNFSCHPDVVGGNKYSADYIGEFSRAMLREYGGGSLRDAFTGEKGAEDFGLVYLNGCCGDINHIDALGGTSLPRGKNHLKMGRILAADAMGVFEKIATEPDATVGSAITSFRGERRRPTEADVEWSKKILADPSSGPVDTSYAKSLKLMHETPLPNPDIELQALRVGDLAICSLPGEIFVEIGLEIKAKSPIKNNMMCELANGYYGYISTAEAINAGGYETRINYSTNMAADTAPRMVEGHIKLLNEIAEK